MSADTEDRIPPACPRCGGAAVPVIWGYPHDEDFEAAERGEVRLGGCIVPTDEPWPEWSCPACRADLPAPGVSP